MQMMGVTDFVSEIKRVENYPDFEKSVHFIQHGLQRQEPITRSLQLPHIPVTAFSQTDLFLVWVYLKFRSQSNLSDQ